MPTPNISVNTKLLARALGLADWPADVPLDTDLKCMAARVVTDFLNNSSNGTSPKVALEAATYWLAAAKAEGYTKGLRDGDEKWEIKIKSLFGVR